MAHLKRHFVLNSLVLFDNSLQVRSAGFLLWVAIVISFLAVVDFHQGLIIHDATL